MFCDFLSSWEKISMVTAVLQAQYISGDHNYTTLTLILKSNKSKTTRESAEWRHYLSLSLWLKSFCALNYLGVLAQHNSGDHNLQAKLSTLTLTLRSNKSKTTRESAEWRHYLSLPLRLGDEEGERLKSFCALNYLGVQAQHNSGDHNLQAKLYDANIDS